MPNPTRSDVHVNAPLTNVSIAYLQDDTKFISSSCFPLIGVPKQSDLYFQYDQGDFLRSEAKLRAPGTESAGAGYDLTTASYSADVFALHKDVADQIRQNADAPLNMDADATKFLTQQMLIKRDRDWATNFFSDATATTWTGSNAGGGGDITPGTKWDAANATPIQDIETQADSVEAKTGFRANTLVLGVDAYQALKNSADVVDRIRYTQTGVVTEDILAAVLGMKKVLIARAVYNSALQGATDSISHIYTGDRALLLYVPDSPSLMHPSAGYTFAWTGYQGSGPDGQRVSRFRMDQLRSDRIEMEMAYDQKQVSSVLGARFVSVDT
tara:strand:+ start:8274 stop:9254 length:981 start_codon:yes stop_codon:yes gene_type:complete